MFKVIVLITLLLNAYTALANKSQGLSMTIIDHDKNSRVEEFEKKLSIKNATSFSYTNLMRLVSLQWIQLDLLKGEELTSMYDYQGPYLMGLLGIDFILDIELLYSIELINKHKGEEHIESVWAGYLEHSRLNTTRILDKAKSYDDFKEIKVGDFTVYSFRTRNRENCKLYYPIHFYLDEHSIIIGDLKDLKAILLNTSKENLRENSKNKATLSHTFISKLQKYKGLTNGVLQSVDFNAPLETISSIDIRVEKSETDLLILKIKFSQEESTADIDYLIAEINKQNKKMRKNLKRLNNPDKSILLKLLDSIVTEKTESTVTFKIIITKELFYLFDDNLITGIESFIMSFPELLDNGINFDNLEDVRKVPEDILKKPTLYKEKYRESSDMPATENKNDHYLHSGLGSKMGINKIWYIDKDETQLAFSFTLKSELPSNVEWARKFITFHTPEIKAFGGKPDIQQDLKCGDYRLDTPITFGESFKIEQHSALLKNKKHSEVKSISGSVGIAMPAEVKSKIFTKKDIGNNTSLNKYYFKLLSIKKNSFSYVETGMLDTIIEYRPLNKKGEPLVMHASSLRKHEYANGLKRKKMTRYASGIVDSIQVFYVDRFRTENHSAWISPTIVKMNEPPTGNVGEVSSISYSKLKEKYFNESKNSWNTLGDSNDFEKQIQDGKWIKKQIGHYELYIENDYSCLSEICFKFKLHAPKEKLFENSTGLLTLTINEVKTDSGKIYKRPTDKERIKQEENRYVSYNGLTNINWFVTPKFSDVGTHLSSSSVALVGINEEKGESFKSFKGVVKVKMPESLEVIDVERLFVGDEIKAAELKYKVIRYENGRFYIRFDKGAEQFIGVQAVNQYTKELRSLRVKFEAEDVISVDTIHYKEMYRFTISNKVNVEEFPISFEL